MARERPLDPPHKGLRHQLGLLSLLTGRTDWSDAQDVEELRAVAGFTFRLLVEHAMNEDDFLFPALERVVPGATAQVEAEHPQIEAAVASLSTRYAAATAGMSEEQGHALYLDFSDFHSAYLAHMLREEREIEPLLVEHLSDEDLALIQVGIAEVSEPTILLDWFEVCVPARSDRDDRVVLERMKLALAPEAFEAIRLRLHDVLDRERFSVLFAAL